MKHLHIQSPKKMLSIIVEVKGIHEVLSISGCPLAFFHFKHLSHNIIHAFVITSKIIIVYQLAMS